LGRIGSATRRPNPGRGSRPLPREYLEEILLWLGDFEDISVYTDENPIYRKQQIENFLDAYEAGELDGHPSILCVNYEWIRLVMTHRKGKPMMPAIERVIGMKLHETPEDDEDPKQVKKSQFKFQENLNYAFEQLGIERDPHWDLDDCLWELVTTLFRSSMRVRITRATTTPTPARCSVG
jgi:hypothetical protein